MSAQSSFPPRRAPTAAIIARGDIPAYTELDARYGWRVNNSFELSLVGQNLLHSRHREYFEDLVHSPQLQVQRSFYVQAKWRF